VLEDDIITSRYFLKNIFNDGLNVYKEASQVYAINSYMFPIQTDKVDTFFVALATSTWVGNMGRSLECI